MIVVVSRFLVTLKYFKISCMEIVSRLIRVKLAATLAEQDHTMVRE